MMKRSREVISGVLKRKAMVIARRIARWDKPLGIIIVREENLLALVKPVCDILSGQKTSCISVSVGRLGDVLSKYRVVVVSGKRFDWATLLRFSKEGRSKIIVFSCCSLREIPDTLRKNIITVVGISGKEFELLVKRAARIYSRSLISLGIRGTVSYAIVKNLLSFLHAKGKLRSIKDVFCAWGEIIKISKIASDTVVSPSGALVRLYRNLGRIAFSCDSEREVIVQEVFANSAEQIKVAYRFEENKYEFKIKLMSLRKVSSEINRYVIVTYGGNDRLIASEIISSMGYLIDKGRISLICPLRRDLLRILRCVGNFNKNSPIWRIVDSDLLYAFLATAIVIDLNRREELTAEYVAASYLLYILALVLSFPNPERMWEKQSDFLRRIIANILSIDYFLAKKILESIYARLSREGIEISVSSKRNIAMRWGELLGSIAHEIRFRLELLA